MIYCYFRISTQWPCKLRPRVADVFWNIHIWHVRIWFIYFHIYAPTLVAMITMAAYRHYKYVGSITPQNCIFILLLLYVIYWKIFFLVCFPVCNSRVTLNHYTIIIHTNTHTHSRTHIQGYYHGAYAMCINETHIWRRFVLLCRDYKHV